MLKIYGTRRSRTTRTVWLALELGIPHEMVPVKQAKLVADPLAPDAPLNTLSPAFLAISEMGTIPTIDDDGLVLCESLAINLYLARKHGGPLAPADAAEDALMLQWALFAAAEVEAHALTISRIAGEGRLSEAAGEAEAAVAARLLKRPFGVLERHLTAQDFMVGDRFTVADINTAEVVRYASGYAPLMEAHPNVAGWLARCQARPAFQAMWQARLDEAP